jgi:signal transduction histidine kinase
MNQGLQHRIANAVEAMANGGQRTRGVTPTPQGVHLTLKGTRAGIPPEDIAYLLAPFSPSNPTAPVRT